MIRMFSQNLYSVNKRMTSSSNNKYLIQLSKFAAQLRKPNLKSIKNLTIYYPSTLGYDALSKEYQKNIAQALFNNCQSIQVVIIIATNIISIDGFAIINKKLKVIKDENWIQKQSW